MSRRRWTAVLPTLALLIGIGLLAFAVLHADVRSMGTLGWQLGAALPLALVPGAAWHVLRTAAWQSCFPAALPMSFARLFRVRLAAEAFSFVTIRGVVGEPVKVALLREVAPAVSAAAVALERVAYLAVTLVIVGVAAAVALVVLPLTDGWMRVFRALAVSAAVLIAGLVALLMRRPPHREAGLMVPAADSSNRWWLGLTRFAREVSLRWRELIYGDRRRVVVLLGLESAAFAMMVLEVWVVLWAMHIPITLIGAAAIETLTRVASMLSAFIPGGIGALEASHLAAATAVHASAGAAALMIVRRLRGLIWCAAGFAVAPGAGHRGAASGAPASAPVASGRQEPGARTLVVIDGAETAGAAVSLSDRLGGLPLGERVVRAAAHAGYQRLLIWSPVRRAAWQGFGEHHGRSLEVVLVRDRAEWDRRRAALPAGTFEIHHVPASRDALAAAERDLRASIIKPTDGTLARFNRRLSIPISVWLIRRLRLSANAMSVFVLGLGLYAGWLFSRGDYVSGVTAAAISLVAGILDGCDGELARLQFKESAFGCWLDTLGDYAYYLATFAGLTVGAVHRSGWPGYWVVGAALLSGALLTIGLLVLLRHRATQGRPERLNATAKARFTSGPRWARAVAWLSTCATRAMMPYGIMAFALAGLLEVVLVLAAIGAQIYWISLAVKLPDLLPGALRTSRERRADPITS
jgi:phosphatidylglycerophosphate synthase/uncharacterized membrane protein YbhN (UPF0104 family)